MHGCLRRQQGQPPAAAGRRRPRLPAGGWAGGCAASWQAVADEGRGCGVVEGAPKANANMRVQCERLSQVCPQFPAFLPRRPCTSPPKPAAGPAHPGGCSRPPRTAPGDPLGRIPGALGCVCPLQLAGAPAGTGSGGAGAGKLCWPASPVICSCLPACFLALRSGDPSNTG